MTLAGSMLGLFTGGSTFLVGVEDDPGGGIRCYLGHRANGHYCIVEDPAATKQVRNAWASGGHVAFPTPPPDCIYSDDETAPLPSRETEQTK